MRFVCALICLVSTAQASRCQDRCEESFRDEAVSEGIVRKCDAVNTFKHCMSKCGMARDYTMDASERLQQEFREPLAECTSSRGLPTGRSRFRDLPHRSMGGDFGRFEDGRKYLSDDFRHGMDRFHDRTLDQGTTIRRTTYEEFGPRRDLSRNRIQSDFDRDFEGMRSRSGLPRSDSSFDRHFDEMRSRVRGEMDRDRFGHGEQRFSEFRERSSVIRDRSDVHARRPLLAY